MLICLPKSACRMRHISAMVNAPQPDIAFPLLTPSAYAQDDLHRLSW
jgi:hypothetical protein